MHTETAACLRESGLQEVSPSCWSVCIECHEPTQPIESIDIYVSGDAEICLRCHPSKTTQANDNLLLRIGFDSGGNHPVDIPYDPLRSRTALKENPQGPLLFVDRNGNFPRIHCSTCHDSMSDRPKLLRISNRGSALCIACHNK